MLNNQVSKIHPTQQEIIQHQHSANKKQEEFSFLLRDEPSLNKLSKNNHQKHNDDHFQNGEAINTSLAQDEEQNPNDSKFSPKTQAKSAYSKFRSSKTALNRNYFDNLLEKKKEQTEREQISQRVIFIMKYILIRLILFVANVICLINLVCLSYMDVEKMDIIHMKWIEPFDCFIGIVFVIELIYHLKQAQFPHEIYDINRLLELINIFEIFWNFFGGTKNIIVIFMRSLRALRVKRVRKQFLLAKFYFSKVLSLEEHSEIEKEEQNYIEDDELENFLIDSIVEFLCGIFFQSALILSLDEALDNEGFVYNDGKLDYIGASYFVIVSFSTIGYGEIYPIKTASRLFMAVLLVINITIMSNFLSNLIEQIYNQSSFVRTYDFYNHVVLIGKLPEPYLVRFISELIEYDTSQRETKSSLVFQMRGIQVIIVGPNEPSSEIRSMISYYTENARYDNEIGYLKANIYEDNFNWYIEANLLHCKNLFSFSQSQEGDAYKNDMEQAFITKEIKSNFPDLPITLILQSSFKELIQTDSLFKELTIISSKEFNESVMGNSIENVGFSTFIQHLLSIKEKQVPQIIMEMLDENSNQVQYIKDMQQEMYSIHMNNSFVGKTFQEAASILYFCGLNWDGNRFTNDRLATLIAIETHIEQDQLIALKKNVSECSSAFMTQNMDSSNIKQLKKILINPKNYKIKKNDIGYVICENYQEAFECNQLTSESLKYSQYLNIEEELQKLKSTNFSEILQEWANLNRQQREEKVKKSLIKKKHHSKKSNISMRRQSNTLNLHQQIKKFQQIYDFTQNEYPSENLYNHTVIIGSLKCFKRQVEILRAYTKRTIALFTEDTFDQFWWNEITEIHKNIFFFSGEFHNVNHIQHLSIGTSYGVLILSSASDDLFLDSDAICLARVIQENFDQTNYLVELQDDSTIQFFSKNLNFKHEKNAASPYIYPAFQNGSIHFSSCFFGLLSRCVYDSNWLNFFSNLLSPLYDDDQQNRKVCQNFITEEIASECKYFGILQYYLHQHKPSAIGIALIKSLYPQNLQTMTTEGNETELKGIYGKIIGSRVVLTNPSFFTLIEKDDILMTIGTISLDQQLLPKKKKKLKSMDFNSVHPNPIFNESPLMIIPEEEQKMAHKYDEPEGEEIRDINKSLKDINQNPFLEIVYIESLCNSHFDIKSSKEIESSNNQPSSFRSEFSSRYSEVQNKFLLISYHLQWKQQNEKAIKRNKKKLTKVFLQQFKNLLVTEQRKIELVQEANQLHQKSPSNDSFKYLRCVKMVERFQKMKRRIKLKNKVDMYLRTKVQFYKETSEYSDVFQS